MMRKLEGRKGFTMVELIVVIAVLAIIAAIAIPIAGDLLADANTSSDASNIALLQDAIEKYVAQNHAYPTTSAGAVAAVQANTTIDKSGLVLDMTPKDGASTSAYCYNTGTHRVSVMVPAGDDVAISLAMP